MILIFFHAKIKNLKWNLPFFMREIFAQKKYGWHKKVGMRKLKRMQELAVFFFFFFTGKN
jgi:hypothetical protein